MKITVELRMLILLAAQPFIKYTVWDSNHLSNNDDDHSCSRKSTKLHSVSGFKIFYYTITFNASVEFHIVGTPGVISCCVKNKIGVIIQTRKCR